MLHLFHKIRSGRDVNDSLLLQSQHSISSINNEKVQDVSAEEDMSSLVESNYTDLCFSFHWKGLKVAAPEQQQQKKKKMVHHSLRERYGEVANKIMYRDCWCLSSEGYTYETFNDLPDYLRLRAKKGCVRVWLWKVCFQFHRDHLVGLQAYYCSLFEDGSLRKTIGTDHLSFYCRNAMVPIHWSELREFSVELNANEFISNIRSCHPKTEGTRSNQDTGEIVGMVLVTNLRIIKVGSCEDYHGGDDNSNNAGEDDDIIKVPPLKISSLNAPRIVALTGVTMNGVEGESRGIIQKVGFYTENNAWGVLGPLVMLRWLYEQGRAEILESETATIQKHQQALHSLIELPDEMWRHVLSFLVS